MSWEFLIVNGVPFNFISFSVSNVSCTFLEEMVITHEVHLCHFFQRNVFGFVSDAVTIELFFVYFETVKGTCFDLTFRTSVFCVSYRTNFAFSESGKVLGEWETIMTCFL